MFSDPDHPGKELRCSDCDSWQHNPACAPINIPKDDSFFDDDQGRSCLPFTKSTGKTLRSADGSGIVLEKINLNTGYLDLSTIYGSSSCMNKQLRTYSLGKMLTTRSPGSPYGLPILTPSSHFTACRTKFNQCYLSGDERSNEHVALLTLHTLFLREHNHIATDLHKLNPAWDDEKLFQEARKMNIAQYQHIITTEFLPLVLSETSLAKLHNLKPPIRPVFTNSYRPEANAQIIDEFATAAFRFGHSLIRSTLMVCDANLLPLTSVPLTSVFNDPSMAQDVLKGTAVDGLLRGLLCARMEQPDLKLVDEIRNRLFINEKENHFGEDLFARNVARGKKGCWNKFLLLLKIKRIATENHKIVLVFLLRLQFSHIKFIFLA